MSRGDVCLKFFGHIGDHFLSYCFTSEGWQKEANKVGNGDDNKKQQQHFGELFHWMKFRNNSHEIFGGSTKEAADITSPHRYLP